MPPQSAAAHEAPGPTSSHMHMHIYLCIHTSSQAVRCASAVLEVVRGFSLDGFAQGALSACTITLHAGMGVGELSVLYVGGGNQRHDDCAEDAAQPSVLQMPQGLGLGSLP